MDRFFPGNSMTNITNGMIDSIRSDRGNVFVTVTYQDCPNCPSSRQTVVLIVTNNTLIFDENGNIISARDLREGMTINATFSSAMTRSIPPQATAFIIRIVRRQRPPQDNVTIGRIVDVDRQNRSFITVSNRNLSTTIRFNVPQDAVILNRMGRPIEFSRLVPGLRVRVRHAAFMTASIPPQTTAFEVRII